MTVSVGTNPRESQHYGGTGPSSAVKQDQSVALARLDALKPGRIRVSYEFFPPKTDKAEDTLFNSVSRLAPLSPQFVSVTYGAGGSTRERTRATVIRIQKETGLNVAAHLTCVGATQDEIDTIARDFWSAGIRHILALRGDPPGGMDGVYEPHPGGYPFALDLVEGLRKVADFDISVACYPETHPQAPSAQADLDYLKRKIDAGASRAVSQFIFDNDAFLRFKDQAAAAGINVPILPGILPISNFSKAQQFAKACGAQIPSWFAEIFDGLDSDPTTRQLVAATVAAEQCRYLHARGVDDFHFYTLNRWELTNSICHMLGVRPPLAKAEEEAAA